MVSTQASRLRFLSGNMLPAREVPPIYSHLVVFMVLRPQHWGGQHSLLIVITPDWSLSAYKLFVAHERVLPTLTLLRPDLRLCWTDPLI